MRQGDSEGCQSSLNPQSSAVSTQPILYVKQGRYSLRFSHKQVAQVVRKWFYEIGKCSHVEVTLLETSSIYDLRRILKVTQPGPTHLSAAYDSVSPRPHSPSRFGYSVVRRPPDDIQETYPTSDLTLFNSHKIKTRQTLIMRHVVLPLYCVQYVGNRVHI